MAQSPVTASYGETRSRAVIPFHPTAAAFHANRSSGATFHRMPGR